jgi:hypothetical protein
LAYLGNRPAESFASFEKQVFTIVNSQTAYTLSHSVVNENDIRLVVNNVVQEPGSGKAYTASGTTLTLSAALTNGTDTMYCVFLGRALQTVNAPNASVGSSQVSADLITGQTAETSIATDDTILIHDTSASALRKMTRANFVSGVGGVNKNLFLAYNNSSDTISNAAWTKVTIDTEVYDTASAFDTSNYRFTVPSNEGGYYYFHGMVNGRNTSNRLRDMQTAFYKNGSHISTKYGQSAWNHADSGDGNFRGFSLSHTLVVNLSAGDYIELYTYITVSTGSPIIDEITTFGGYKLNT